MRGCAAYQSPSGEKYDSEEDIPPDHVTLKGAMLPSDKGATVYSSFLDVKDGKFKAWDSIMDTTAIPKDAEVLPPSWLSHIHGRLSCSPVAHTAPADAVFHSRPESSRAFSPY